MSDHDQTFAAAFGRSQRVLASHRARRNIHGFPRPKATFAIAGDDPRPWIPHFSQCREQPGGSRDGRRGDGLLGMLPERDGISGGFRSSPVDDSFFISGIGCRCPAVAQGARTTSSIDRRERGDRVRLSMPESSSIKIGSHRRADQRRWHGVGSTLRVAQRERSSCRTKLSRCAARKWTHTVPSALVGRRCDHLIELIRHARPNAITPLAPVDLTT